MEIIDEFKTIDQPSQGEYKEKGSKFLAYAFPVNSINNIEECLLLIKKEHPKARHFCYAYRLGVDKLQFRINDDGEPSGTAGRPILGAIDSFEVTDIIIVIVRYFGGTKLGASGLIQAYKKSSINSLANATISTKYIYNQFRLDFGYEHLGIIMECLKSLSITIVNKNLNNTPSLVIGLRESMVDHEIKKIKGYLLGRSVDDIDEDTILDICSFTLIE